MPNNAPQTLMYMNHLRSLLRCKFSFSRSGVETKILHFYQEMLMLLTHTPYSEGGGTMLPFPWFRPSFPHCYMLQ